MFRTQHFLAASAAIAALAAAPQAGALTLTLSDFDMYVYGITPGQGVPPGGLLEFAGLEDDTDGDGAHQIRAGIGTGSTGLPVLVEAGVGGFGKTFFGVADTPNNFQKPVGYIGSTAEVLVYREYVKDGDDDRLNFTYTDGLLSTFFNVEFGRLCPTGDDICLNAGMLGEVSVYDAANQLVWQRSDSANVFSTAGLPRFDYGVVGDLPWAPRTVGGSGFSGLDLVLEGQATRPIDISGIGTGSTFTVQYRLLTFAYDRGSDLGFQRGALAFAKDPSGGFGVSFEEISGGSGGEDPVPAPVPLPAAGWLVLAGLTGLSLPRLLRRGRRD